MALEAHLAKLPSDGQSCAQMLAEKDGIRRLRLICENVESNDGKAKLIAAQCESFKIQLCIYLIQNELALAKHLWKRLRRELRDPGSVLLGTREEQLKVRELTQKGMNLDDARAATAPSAEIVAKRQQRVGFLTPHSNEIQAIWAIGKALWKEEYEKIYNLCANPKGLSWSKHIAPLIEKVASSHRERMVTLVSKAFTSIKEKELMEIYLGTGDQGQVALKQLVNGGQWKMKGGGVVEICKGKSDEASFDADMLAKLTQYVCFMESEQKLEIDEMAAEVKK